MEKIYEFLKACGTYYLATVEGDQPRVRPFGTVDLFEGKLYIQTGKDFIPAVPILFRRRILHAVCSGLLCTPGLLLLYFYGRFLFLGRININNRILRQHLSQQTL